MIYGPSNLSSPRTTFGCTVLDNKIFIAGGRNTIVGNNDSSDYYNRDLIIFNNNGQSIYDLQGRRLQAPPQKGLYIQDGKVRGN